MKGMIRIRSTIWWTLLSSPKVHEKTNLHVFFVIVVVLLFFFLFFCFTFFLRNETKNICVGREMIFFLKKKVLILSERETQKGGKGNLLWINSRKSIQNAFGANFGLLFLLLAFVGKKLFRKHSRRRFLFRRNRRFLQWRKWTRVYFYCR